MKLPSLRPKQVVRVLERIGYKRVRQTGSYLIMVDMAKKKIIPVPLHNKDLKRGLLASIIKQTDLPAAEFIKYLR